MMNIEWWAFYKYSDRWWNDASGDVLNMLLNDVSRDVLNLDEEAWSLGAWTFVVTYAV